MDNLLIFINKVVFNTPVIKKNHTLLKKNFRIIKYYKRLECLVIISLLKISIKSNCID
jgi:hypothetical protein